MFRSGKEILSLEIATNSSRVTVTRSQTQSSEPAHLLIPMDMKSGPKLLDSTKDSFAYVTADFFNDLYCRPQKQDLVDLDSFRMICFVDFR